MRSEKAEKRSVRAGSFGGVAATVDGPILVVAARERFRHCRVTCCYCAVTENRNRKG